MKYILLGRTLLAVSSQANAICSCYCRKYYRTPYGLEYRDDFIANVVNRSDCDTFAGRLGYDAFYVR